MGWTPLELYAILSNTFRCVFAHRRTMQAHAYRAPDPGWSPKGLFTSIQAPLFLHYFLLKRYNTSRGVNPGGWGWSQPPDFGLGCRGGRRMGRGGSWTDREIVLYHMYRKYIRKW